MLIRSILPMPPCLLALRRSQPWSLNGTTKMAKIMHQDRMIQCLTAGMRAASNKAVNYDKLREVIQEPNENPAMFLNRLTEALTQYTRLDPASLAGVTVLATHLFLSQLPTFGKNKRKRRRALRLPFLIW